MSESCIANSSVNRPTGEWMSKPCTRSCTFNFEAPFLLVFGSCSTPIAIQCPSISVYVLTRKLTFLTWKVLSDFINVKSKFHCFSIKQNLTVRLFVIWLRPKNISVLSIGNKINPPATRGWLPPLCCNAIIFFLWGIFKFASLILLSIHFSRAWWEKLWK
jgi:hypothetical protein